MHNVGCGQEHAKSRWHVLIKHFSFLNTCKKVLGAFGNVMSQKTPNELPQRWKVHYDIEMINTFNIKGVLSHESRGIQKVEISIPKISWQGLHQTS
jgi:hypothetical protein